MTTRSLVLFVVRRLAALALILVAVTFLIFSLLDLAPGNAVQVLLGTRPATPQLIHRLRVEYHLDKPFFEQYWLWLRNALRLDFGTSNQTGRTVSSMISERFGVSAFLGAYAFVLAMVVGVPLGVLAAVRRRRLSDRIAVSLSVFGFSTPAFVSGVFFLYLFAVRLSWFPTYGAGSGLIDRFWHLSLPAVALSLVVMALVVKLTRAAMINVLDQDYVAFALARGVPTGRVLVRYGIRNALVSLITAGGVILTAVLTGAVVVETTFAVPGIGSLFVSAIQAKDLPVVQAIAVLLATSVVLISLSVDMLYVVADPRIAYGRSAA